jgi:ketosteroid isomerase-like protein
MRKIIYVAAAVICFSGCVQTTTKDKNITQSEAQDLDQEDLATAIITMEKTALDKLNKGNPSGFLEIYADDITYFDPFREKRFDGFEKVKTFYESMQGAFRIDSCGMIEPVVQIAGETAVLSYNLASYIGSDVFREKCTEVYRQQPDKQWKIIHSHWSVITPVTEKE